MPFKTSLPPDALTDALSLLRSEDLALAGRAGQAPGRMPVHTVYGGAHLFRADTARKLGDLALRSLDTYARDAAALAAALGLPDTSVRVGEADAMLARAVHARIVDKLRREPVEDLRIDFEDGYGARPGAEEDEHAAAAAREVAQGLAAGSLPPGLGIRIKSLGPETRDRALRTLDVFLSSLTEASGGALPEGFVTTLPKVQSPAQIRALVDVLERLEGALRLDAGALRLELMIETTQALVGPRGEIALPALLDAAQGRCVGVHFGAYDYTAACGITAAHQDLAHTACDFARSLMQVALAGSGVRVADGATTVLPIPPHRAAADGPPLSAQQADDNRRAVHRAWRLHYERVRRALIHGYYQGWDLHPAQLPARYAAVYAFFLEALEPAAERLRGLIDKAAQATVAGVVYEEAAGGAAGPRPAGAQFDDAATGQGLLGFFVQAISAGALTEEEAAARTGLSADELGERSFLKIAERRRR